MKCIHSFNNIGVFIWNYFLVTIVIFICRGTESHYVAQGDFSPMILLPQPSELEDFMLCQQPLMPTKSLSNSRYDDEHL